jgi:hypothetical protein
MSLSLTFFLLLNLPIMFSRHVALLLNCTIVRLKREGTRAETRFRLSPKRTSPFKSAGTSVQSTAGSRGVLISVSSAGYTAFRGSVRVLATHSIRQFPSCASQCALGFKRTLLKMFRWPRRPHGPQPWVRGTACTAPLHALLSVFWRHHFKSRSQRQRDPCCLVGLIFN